MSTRTVHAAGRDILTDREGYVADPAEWSEAFARALAEEDAIDLTVEHWEAIRFLREHYAAHGRQASVRDMIRHFNRAWGEERVSNRYLHRLFPQGGPQKQGNRLAGLLRTKGEHCEGSADGKQCAHTGSTGNRVPPFGSRHPEGHEMKRNPALRDLSSDHHAGLVLVRRIRKHDALPGQSTAERWKADGQKTPKTRGNTR
jgi:TusE/DsrC/DsvC family sulfur relay protein